MKHCKINYRFRGDHKDVNNLVKLVEKIINPQELQEKIINSFGENTIRLEKTLKKTPQKLGLEEFLYRFFTDYNINRNTIYNNTSEIQTNLNCRRSLGDIFMICKYYFPEITLLEVLKILYIVLPNRFEKGFRTSYCYTINKKVWYYDGTEYNFIGNKDKEDEYGNKYHSYLKLFNN